MPPRLTACLRVVVVLISSAAALRAQGARQPIPPGWNDPRTIELVDRAIARRSAQLADTGLADYRALAHGYLTFLAQLGDGYPDPPQVVRADELAVEVYWRAPNQSKQRVVGRRDTLMLPTDIAYHRDHLAIVQNNFPAIIRLGDGDEVRDVPHPLSQRGREAYDFATTDSLALRAGPRSWDVIRVDVRPRDDRQPRVVGSLYLDRETAAVVRMSISFTRAALLDPALEDVSVVLDNGLVEGRFWLPRRQEIEIRRSGTWLDFPARGIIRGEWDLCCMESNRGVPAEFFTGPEVVFAPPAALAAYPFAGRLTDSLAPRLKAALDDGSVRRVQEHAAALVRAAALNRAAGATISARRLSDFVRVNRVEGLSLGGGATFRLSGPWSVRSEVHYGLDDRQLKHDIAVAWRPRNGPTFSFSAFDVLRGAADTPETSLLANSLAAQEIGVDLTDDFRAAGIGVAVQGGERLHWRASVEWVRESAVSVHAAPFSGTYRPAFAADANTSTRVRWDGSATRLDGPFGSTWDVGSSLWLVSAEVAGAPARRVTYSRARVNVSAELAMGSGTLVVRTIGGSDFGAQVPEQHRVLFGGPVTAPGYDAHALRGTTGASTRVEWQVPVASFPVALGRFGTTRVRIVAAPFVQGAVVSGSAYGAASAASAAGASWRRTVGLGIISFHDVLRFDLVRGVDAGGRWALRLDFGRSLWPIL